MTFFSNYAYRHLSNFVTADQENITGFWLNENATLSLTIYKKDNLYMGNVHQLYKEDPHFTCGQELLKDLTFKNGLFVGGTVYIKPYGWMPAGAGVFQDILIICGFTTGITLPEYFSRER